MKFKILRPCERRLVSQEREGAVPAAKDTDLSWVLYRNSLPTPK